MSFLTEYKDEVGSLTLSAEFKENLKKACISQAAKAAGEDEKPQIEVAEGGASDKDVLSKMKLYKYISIAASLIAVISSIGVVSLMSLRVTTSKDAAGASEDYNASSVYEDGEDIATADIESDTEDNFDTNAESADESDTDEVTNDVTQMYQGSMEGKSYSIAPEELPAEDYEDEQEDDDSSVYSVTMNSPDYDGDYNTEDYVLMLASSQQMHSSNVFDSDEELISAVGVKTSDVTESLVSNSYNALNFYDILANELKDEAESGGASLVRMRVTGIADSNSTPSPNSNAYTPYNVNIEYDYLNQTSCDVDAIVWIIGTEDNQVDGMPTYAKGSVILTSLYVNPNGSVTAVDELLYDVYTLSDQDIAYHRYYEKINPGYTDMGILDEERTFVTTTENNPVEYVHKAVTKELSRYIRRKIVGEGYDFVDLEWLGKVSVGEAEPWAEPDEPEEEPQPEEEQTQQEADPDVKPIKNARVTVTDDRMVITSAGQQIFLHDEASCDYIELLFRNSASSITTYTSSSTAMFVGGKLTFSSNQAFDGEITEIEITSVGCPLSISFNGVSVGDSLESAMNTFGIRDTLDPNCTLTYRSDNITATMNFEYGTLAKLVIK